MKYVKLGDSDIEVSRLCFGGNVFGWTADKKTSFKLLDAWLDQGFNFIDTADVYSTWVPGNKGGESETIIGEWLRQSGNREKIVLATKVGAEMAPDKKGLRASYIAKAVEDSLRRLQTDYIDLYQSHYDDTSTPVEEALEVYSNLATQGKIRIAGASNFSPERLSEALKASESGHLKYQTFQPEYNLVERNGYEREYADLVDEFNLSVISYYSLASGFLTGKYRTESDLAKSPRGGGAKKYLESNGLAVLEILDKLALTHKATPAQVSLAWLLSRPHIAAPIVSATNIQQLEDIAGAVSLSLNAADLAKLDEVSK